MSGFGQWVNEVVGHEGKLSDGVRVIHRDDSNYFEVANDICNTVKAYTNASSKERTAYRNNAASLANKAQWKHFIKCYYDAYDFALRTAIGTSTNE